MWSLTVCWNVFKRASLYALGLILSLFKNDLRWRRGDEKAFGIWQWLSKVGVGCMGTKDSFYSYVCLKSFKRWDCPRVQWPTVCLWADPTSQESKAHGHLPASLSVRWYIGKAQLVSTTQRATGADQLTHQQGALSRPGGSLGHIFYTESIFIWFWCWGLRAQGLVNTKHVFLNWAI